MIRGPAVGDAEFVFRERWEDPAPPTRNPVQRVRDLVTGVDDSPDRLPPQLADPPPCGTHAVQLLRTYPYRRFRYSFAPDGERSIARGYAKALPRAQSLIYLEDQYLWSTDVAQVLADALAANPGLHLIAVLPRLPDQDGRLSRPPNLVGRVAALDALYAAGGGRVAVYFLENHAGVPIYVHAKACVVDDDWAIIGSDNFSRRSWTHDSELSCAILDTGAGGERGTFARDFRMALASEHLGGTPDGAGELAGMFRQFRESAARLDGWYEGGRRGRRPPGQLRAYPTPRLSPWTTRWASVPYRILFDPDGRPPALRRAGQF
jgi:phosphatidylserine/phosphatidylglycerophosphate/cardiolipin synthase-like enzyme